MSYLIGDYIDLSHARWKIHWSLHRLLCTHNPSLIQNCYKTFPARRRIRQISLIMSSAESLGRFSRNNHSLRIKSSKRLALASLHWSTKRRACFSIIHHNKTMGTWWIIQILEELTELVQMDSTTVEARMANWTRLIKKTSKSQNSMAAIREITTIIITTITITTRITVAQRIPPSKTKRDNNNNNNNKINRNNNSKPKPN